MTSGAIQFIDPTKEFFFASGLIQAATPKSPSLTDPSVDNRIFPDFISRWYKLFLFRHFKPSKQSRIIVARIDTSFIPCGYLYAIMLFNDPAFISGITM